MKKILLGLSGLALIALSGVELGAAPAYANKVDCDKVMAEVGAGKKAADIAKDLSISTSSVYRCKKKAKAATGSAAAPTGSAAEVSPMAAASPTGSTKAKRHKKSKSGGTASPAAAPSP